MCHVITVMLVDMSLYLVCIKENLVALVITHLVLSVLLLKRKKSLTL